MVNLTAYETDGRVFKSPWEGVSDFSQKNFESIFHREFSNRLSSFPLYCGYGKRKINKKFSVSRRPMMNEINRGQGSI